MDNPEFIELKNRFFFGLFISFIIVVCGILLFSLKFNDGKSKVIKKIYNNESFLLFIFDSKNDSEIINIKNKLNDLNVNYFDYDIHRNKDYRELCYKLNINYADDISPSLIYINNGEILRGSYNIDDDDVISFIDNLNR